MSAKTKWRCFHCDEVFTERSAAQAHFGESCHREPICQMSAEQVRIIEYELDRFRQEDTDLHRQIAHLQSEVRSEFKRGEEIGYNRGLEDGRNLKP